MGLWSSGISRSKTNEYRMEDIGKTIHDLERIKNFIKSFDGILTCTYTNNTERFVTRWTISTSNHTYHIDTPFNTSEFSYSILLNLHASLNRFKQGDEYVMDNDGIMIKLLMNMRKNINVYLNGLFTSENSFESDDILFTKHENL